MSFTRPHSDAECKQETAKSRDCKEQEVGGVSDCQSFTNSVGKPKGLLGGHLNIRSILSKSEQIQHLLLDSNLDFLCLSETWLSQNAPLAALNIPGYNIYRKDREGSKKGGGVMVYIKSTLVSQNPVVKL